MSELILRLAQPAQLGDRPGKDSVLTTLDHLPGSVIRGAFAARWVAVNGEPGKAHPRRAEFLRMFEGGVRFGSLLPAGTEAASLAIVRHKYQPAPDCAEIEYDRAAGGEPPLHCPDCRSPLEQVPAGTLRDAGSGDGDVKIGRQRRTSVSVDEHGLARPHVLFTRETLPRDHEFRGTLTGDAELLSTLAGLGPVQVGGRRTTHGLATVAIADGDPPGIEQLPDGRLIVRLRSPAVFTDDDGRPSAQPSPAYLKATFGTPAQVATCWTRWAQTGGWHIASGLPKPVELAVAAGSTFLLEPEQPVAPRLLTDLAHRGVGLRRHEGFGDLARPPVLAAGANARRREQQRLSRLTGQMAPLIGIKFHWTEAWPQIRDAMIAHTVGDASATRVLLGAALDTRTEAAMRVFTELPRPDAEYVLKAQGVR